MLFDGLLEWLDLSILHFCLDVSGFFQDLKTNLSRFSFALVDIESLDFSARDADRSNGEQTS